MKKKTKLYLKLNLVSLFFIAVSFISMTLAWFVYSGLSSVNTEVSVKAWYIELEKSGEVVSNNIVISLDDIYPGMQPLEEEIKIKNRGDSNAQVKYEITSIRILDEEFSLNDEITSDYLEDTLSHYYPFHINIDLNKRYILAKTDETTFKVSISWPLDSGPEADLKDSEWGTKAYKFRENEQKLKDLDDLYQMRNSIKLDIKLIAEQYIESDESNSDIAYRFGNEILYDIEANKRCYQESTTCIKTNVIDANNKVGDEEVILLPKIINIDSSSISNYDTISDEPESLYDLWNANIRLLTIQDVLYPISKDITSSVIERPNISDSVIGNLNYDGRIDDVILKATSAQGIFKFLNKYSYFTVDTCYWLYDANNDKDNIKENDKFYIVSPYDENTMKIYESLTTEQCKIVPVIIANKEEHLGKKN